MEALRADPEWHYLYDLRNDVEKVGSVGFLDSLIIGSKPRDQIDYQRLMVDPPPHARGFKINDMWGGSGWEVVAPSGEVRFQYVDVPDDIGFVTRMYFCEATSSLRLQPPDTPIEDVLVRYVAFLNTIHASARDLFTPSQEPA
ncbi:MAG: hypothetical protein JO198_03000 [Candidatus Dormibacteraeota bacterium]|nr:hypothetical protein [Candidatus Dormibacteraeota bacterium]